MSSNPQRTVNHTYEGGIIKKIGKTKEGVTELAFKGLEGKTFLVSPSIEKGLKKASVELREGDRLIADYDAVENNSKARNIVRMDVYRNQRHLGTYSGYPLIPGNPNEQVDRAEVYS